MDQRARYPSLQDRHVLISGGASGIGATLVRDDRLFRAAVVSMGSFGVMHAVLFEAEPIYHLEVHRRPCTWQGLTSGVCGLDTVATWGTCTVACATGLAGALATGRSRIGRTRS